MEVPDKELCTTASLYREFQLRLHRVSAQTANGQARLIHRYVRWAQSSYTSKNDADILLNHEFAENFITVLRRLFRPYSIKNHAAAVASCLDLLLCDQDFRSELGLSYASKPRIQSAKDVWLSLKRTDERVARSLQRAKVRNGSYRDVHVKSLFDFLCINDHKVDAIIKSWGDQLFADSPTPHDMDLVQAYCALILAMHGQRLCAALNLTARAVTDAVRASGVHVMRIVNHKTSRTSGPAAVGLRPSHYRVFRALARLRIAQHGSDAKLLQAPKNRASKVIFAPVDRHVAAIHPGWEGLTFNALRVTLETHSYLANSSSVATDPDKCVSSYLMHSKKVTDLHYSFRSDSRVAAEAYSVQGVLAQLLLMDLARARLIAPPQHRTGEISTIS